MTTPITNDEYRASVLLLESHLNDSHLTGWADVFNLAQFAGRAAMADVTKRLIFYTKKPDSRRLDDAISLEGNLLQKLGLPSGRPTRVGSPHISSRMVHAILGLATEAGELVEELLNAIAEDRPLNMDNIFEEFGDHSWYHELGLDAAEETEGKGRFTRDNVLRGNIAKLMERYKPGTLPSEVGGPRDYAAEKIAMNAAVVDHTVDVVAKIDVRPVGNGMYKQSTFINAVANTKCQANLTTSRPEAA